METTRGFASGISADPADLTICPRCEGRGYVGPVHINRGSRSHQWIEKMDCDLCRTIGKIDGRQRKAIELGSKLREKRLARDESLRECAQRLGLKASELSAFETGRWGMVPWSHPFATGVCAEIGFYPEAPTS